MSYIYLQLIIYLYLIIIIRTYEAIKVPSFVRIYSYMLAHIIFLYQSISTSKEITTTWLWPDHPAMGWFHLFIAYSQFLAYLTSCNAWQAIEMDAYPTKGSKNTLITFGVPELFDSSRPFCR